MKSRTRVSRITLLLIVGIIISPPLPLREGLYLDPNQPVERRVQDLISRLTLEEKAILLNHRAGHRRLGINRTNGTSASTACGGSADDDVPISTRWPHVDPGLIHEVAATISTSPGDL